MIDKIYMLSVPYFGYVNKEYRLPNGMSEGFSGFKADGSTGLIYFSHSNTKFAFKAKYYLHPIWIRGYCIVSIGVIFFSTIPPKGLFYFSERPVNSSICDWKSIMKRINKHNKIQIVWK